MDMFRISLDDLEFIGRIGVTDQERTVGNIFKVNVSFDFPAEGFRDDVLESTISYADVYDIVRDVMSETHLLLETVARKISFELRRRWPAVCSGKVRITKCSVPVTGITGSCSVEICFN